KRGKRALALGLSSRPATATAKATQRTTKQGKRCRCSKQTHPCSQLCPLGKAGMETCLRAWTDRDALASAVQINLSIIACVEQVVVRQLRLATGLRPGQQATHDMIRQRRRQPPRQ